MSAVGLLALLDDITAILDDVAAMTKVASSQTAGIVGDDLAVNAQVLLGIDPKRELPIVWRVAKGSLRNKFILVPSALFLSAFAPWSITPLLMAGGSFLCYEAAEKILHAVKHTKEDEEETKAVVSARTPEALMELEEKKIRQAINTDLILSAEIVAVALAAVQEASFGIQVGVLTAVGIGMTVVVYGLVAGIVKLDDLGFHLVKKKSKAAQKTGKAILAGAPYLMKTLSVVGTAAMFLVGGGIFLHGIPPIKEAMKEASLLVDLAAAMAAGGVIGLICLPLGHWLAKPFAKLVQGLRNFRKKENSPILALALGGAFLLFLSLVFLYLGASTAIDILYKGAIGGIIGAFITLPYSLYLWVRYKKGSASNKDNTSESSQEK